VRLLALAVAALAACESQDQRVPTSIARTVGIDTIARGLDVPWAIAFAPDGRIFLTERVGRVRVIERGSLRPTPWAVLPVRSVGEAGLMGIALAPDFATSGHVFVVGAFEVGGTMVNRVIRLTDVAGRGESASVVVDRLRDRPRAEWVSERAIPLEPR
jgi:aldose sugar dehydrogenase